MPSSAPPIGAVSMGMNIGVDTLRGNIKSLGSNQSSPGASGRLQPGGSSSRSLSRMALSASVGSLEGSEQGSDDDETTTSSTRSAFGAALNFKMEGGGPLATVADRRFQEKAVDGLLGLEAFMSIVSDLHPEATARQIVLAFRYFDKQGNGSITLREFKDFWNIRDRQAFVIMGAETSTRIERGLALFKAFSADGYIGPGESSSFFQWCKKQNLTPQDTTESNFVKQIDANEDGRINYSELIDWLTVANIQLPDLEKKNAPLSTSKSDLSIGTLESSRPKARPRNAKSSSENISAKNSPEEGRSSKSASERTAGMSSGGELTLTKLDQKRWTPRSKKAIKAHHEMETRLNSKCDHFFHERDKLNGILRKRHDKMRKDIEDHVKKMKREREKIRSGQVKELKSTMKKKGAKSEEILAVVAGGDAEFAQGTLEQVTDYREKSHQVIDTESREAEVSFFRGALETTMAEHASMFDKEMNYCEEEYEIFLKELADKNEEEHKCTLKSVNKYIDDEVKKRKKKGVFMTDSEKKEITDERIGTIKAKHTRGVEEMEYQRDSDLVKLKQEHTRFLAGVKQYYEQKIREHTL